ncbi:MAG: hypothetical protein AAF629_08820 [Chloroflexota bacterium]
MKVTQLEFIYLDVPFSEYISQYLQSWLPDWRISEIYKLTLDNGIAIWSETLPNYACATVPADIEVQSVRRQQ